MTKVPANKKLQNVPSKKALWPSFESDQQPQVSHFSLLNQRNGSGSAAWERGRDEGLGIIVQTSLLLWMVDFSQRMKTRIRTASWAHPISQ